MIVAATTAGSSGAVLRTVMALPRKSMFSTYVPGATMTLSPSEAAAIADWMVG